jgi:hypothetical protein
MVKFTVLAVPELPAPSEPPKSPPIIEINRLNGHVGAEVVVSGTGFVESGTATIEYDDALISSVAISQEGIFLASFNVPVSTHGEHVLTISDGISRKELAFVVEAEAPAPPNLLLGTSLVVKEGAEIFIDWEDVTDKSLPVTYTLQLARDASFSERSILLEMKDLTESEYLVESSINQQLQPRQTYYWRLRAVDSASNTGEWTETGEIIIVPVSQVPDWLMYLLAVLGGLSILFIWYLIRRADRRSR